MTLRDVSICTEQKKEKKYLIVLIFEVDSDVLFFKWIDVYTVLRSVDKETESKAWHMPDKV